MGAKKVDVKVHIEDDPTKYPPKPPYKFWMETDDNKVGKKKGDKLTFANGGKYDGFDITFDLVDETKKGFLFMDAGKLSNGDPDPNLTPMWVKTVDDLDDPCPDHEFWDQFETIKVCANNTKLLVRNRNDHEALFKFALMFSKSPDQAPYEIMYDPGGANQNGPKLRTVVKILAGVVVVGAVAVAYAALR